MLCWSGEGLVIVIVTLPALADSVLLSNLSCDWSAASDSCCPPPPPEDAPLEVVADEPVLEELLSSEPPQPASASSAAAPRMLSRFMSRRLPSDGNEELQQRLLSMQPVLGLIPDCRA